MSVAAKKGTVLPAMAVTGRQPFDWNPFPAMFSVKWRAVVLCWLAGPRFGRRQLHLIARGRDRLNPFPQVRPESIGREADSVQHLAELWTLTQWIIKCHDPEPEKA